MKTLEEQASEVARAYRTLRAIREFYGPQSAEHAAAQAKVERMVAQVNAALLAHQGRQVKEELEAVA